MSKLDIQLNGFKVALSAPTFKGYVQNLPNSQEFKSFIELLGDEWFFHWRKGKLYGIPKVTNPQKSFGQLEDLSCKEHLQLIISRISYLLPDIFLEYNPLKRKPFTFLAQKKELIREVISAVKNLPDIISSFKVFPKYILEAKTFEIQNDEHSKLLIGPAVDATLTEMHSFLTNKAHKFLANKATLNIAPDLQATIGARIEAINTKEYQSVIAASSVEYCFDAARTKKSLYPWVGIDQYGPFSRQTFSKKTPEIIVFFPDTAQGAVENFLVSLRDGISIKNKKIDEDGNVEWQETSRYTGGLAKIFGLFNPKFTLEPLSWLKNTHNPPAIVYRETIEGTLASREIMPDAAMVVLLDNHTRLPDSENPYLHSKSLLLMAGIPVQEVRLATINQSKNELQYTLQNLTVALYAKMNGVPWTVDHDLTIHDELVIGVGTCELSGSRFTERQRFVGITTVFRGDGNYLLGNLSKDCTYDEYPSVLRNSTLSILQEIKNRNGWQPNDTVRLVFHAARPLKDVDVANIIAECVAQVGNEQNVEFAFLTISHDHPFTMLDKSQQGVKVKEGERKGIYAPERGTILQLGRYTRLLSTKGSKLIKRSSTPLPTPLLINLHPQSTYRDLTYLSEQVLKFTSLSWKSLLPASDPVTIYYSELIAGLLARLQNVRGWSPAMLNIKLRASKWFL
ncbi:Piwi domain-containing protein [Microcoleus sp. herbarium19]|uniref:Piwi domain-containing protein n=1 Tax=Microcoleus sp. herbarium19 TaxID=3055440 RepID=UPI002FD10DAF